MCLTLANIVRILFHLHQGVKWKAGPQEVRYGHLGDGGVVVGVSFVFWGVF